MISSKERRNLIDSIDYYLRRYDYDELFIAFSGGIDSSALFHALISMNIQFRVLHVNHGLSNNSDTWENFCKKVSYEHGMTFKSIRLNYPVKNINIEAWCRKSRYNFFKKEISENKFPLLFTAHHLQDQVETFLLRASRGSGIKGLSGIIQDASFNNGRLIRPFLFIDKSIITKYIVYKKVCFVEDESNKKLSYRRNFIRSKIIPKLREQLPSVENAFSLSTRHCFSASQVLDIYLKSDLDKILLDKNFIDLRKFSVLHLLKKQYLLRFWFSNVIEENIKYNQFQQIFSGVINLKGNWSYGLKNILLRIDNKILSFSNKEEELQKIKEEEVLSWFLGYKTTVSIDLINIRERIEGDRCRYPGRLFKNKLKIIFQELKISSKDRKNIKVVCLKKNKNKIVGLYPLFISPDFLKL